MHDSIENCYYPNNWLAVALKWNVFNGNLYNTNFYIYFDMIWS